MSKQKRKQKYDSTKYWQGCGATGTLTHCWQKCKTVQPLWKAVSQFLIKLNIYLPMLQQSSTYLPRRNKNPVHESLQ